MNMSKRIKLGIVSLSSVALLAACGDNGTNDSLGTTPVAPENTEETQADNTGDSTGGTTGEDTTEETGETTDSSNEGTSDDTNDDTGEQANDTDSPGIENIEFPITVQDAIDIFNNEFGSPNIDEIQFDREDGRYVYDFEGWDGEFDYEMKVDAQTGEILSQERDDDSDSDDILDLDGIISPQDAMRIALEATGSGYVEEWHLELEDGVTVYEVDIEGGQDQDVDAHTGEIR